jgi:hypothetical protein
MQHGSVCQSVLSCNVEMSAKSGNWIREVEDFKWELIWSSESVDSDLFLLSVLPLPAKNWHYGNLADNQSEDHKIELGRLFSGES